MCLSAFIFEYPQINISDQPFPKQALIFTCMQYKSFENTVEKEKLLIRAISLFPTAFSNHLKNFLPHTSNLKLLSANSFSLEESKICRLGKG